MSEFGLWNFDVFDSVSLIGNQPFTMIYLEWDAFVEVLMHTIFE